MVITHDQETNIIQFKRKGNSTLGLEWAENGCLSLRVMKKSMIPIRNLDHKLYF